MTIVQNKGEKIMYLPLGTFSPSIKLGFVSASRNCFPRSLSEARAKKLIAACKEQGIDLVVPQGECAVIESRTHAGDAAAQLMAAGCDAAVLFLGNFSPEIEDAQFVKDFKGCVMVLAAAEESVCTLLEGRGDALCGLLSAAMAVEKRGLMGRVFIPEQPLVDCARGVEEIARFMDVMKVVKGTQNMTIGLFGPRPRDFETCNYNLASIFSLGVEVEELGFFDLANEVDKVKGKSDLAVIEKEMNQAVGNIPTDGFINRLSAYEQALLNLKDQLKLSGATTQCWAEQEWRLRHTPCFINGRLAGKGFPIACENDAYSLIAELMGQYATGESVTILDLNHSIPRDLDKSLEQYPIEDMVGLFHCGNTDTNRMKNPKMCAQVIMKRTMEPDKPADITRGTVEGQIAASPITVVQVHGVGDKMRAYIIEGEFLDLDPKTFGSTGTAYLPGFGRFYRHVLLGKFHHHAAVAFQHCGGVLYDALKLLGVEEIYTPNAAGVPYPGENVFRMKK